MKIKYRLMGILIASAFLVTSCSNLLSDNRSVKIYEALPMLPHGTGSYRLVIGGKSYSNVPGGNFIEIPERGIVCFKTEPVIGVACIYVIPIRKTSIKEFRVKVESNSSFGDTFGLDRGRVETTYVDTIKGDEIFFTERFYKRGQNRYRLNLKLHTLEQIGEQGTDTISCAVPHEIRRAAH